jgi:hypothetical protein
MNVDDDDRTVVKVRGHARFGLSDHLPHGLRNSLGLCDVQATRQRPGVARRCSDCWSRRRMTPIRRLLVNVFALSATLCKVLGSITLKSILKRGDWPIELAMRVAASRGLASPKIGGDHHLTQLFDGCLWVPAQHPFRLVRTAD